jgi:hypothetical protein
MIAKEFGIKVCCCQESIDRRDHVERVRGHARVRDPAVAVADSPDVAAHTVWELRSCILGVLRPILWKLGSCGHGEARSYGLGLR